MKHLMLIALAVCLGSCTGIFVGDCVQVMGKKMTVVAATSAWVTLSGQACMASDTFCFDARFTMPTTKVQTCLRSGECSCEN